MPSWLEAGLSATLYSVQCTALTFVTFTTAQFLSTLVLASVLLPRICVQVSALFLFRSDEVKKETKDSALSELMDYIPSELLHMLQVLTDGLHSQ